MPVDYIFNEQVSGDVASTLLAHDMDPNALRPWIGSDGKSYISRATGRVDNSGVPEYEAVLSNAQATLRKDEWQLLDDAVLPAARQRLRVVADMRGAGLTFNVPDGMGTTVLQYQTRSDITPASISMDGMRRGQQDRFEFDLRNLPLPIIHKDFGYTARQIATSRRMGTPLDTAQAEEGGVHVAEMVEKLTLGESGSYQYGGGTIWGFTNFPDRLTKTLTAPTGANNTTVVQEVLQMKTQSQDAKHYGPWMLYCSTAWDEFMDDDYNDNKGDNTLRERLRQIEGINDVRTLDFLSGTTLLLVEQQSRTARIVVGMDVRTVQWPVQGGMGQEFKVMAIIVPQMRSDHNKNTGIVHGSV